LVSYIKSSTLKTLGQRRCFRNWPTRKQKWHMAAIFVTDWDEMSILNRGPSIKASCKMLHPLTNMVVVGNSCFWLIDF
jgi:hypothetical protein